MLEYFAQTFPNKRKSEHMLTNLMMAMPPGPTPASTEPPPEPFSLWVYVLVVLGALGIAHAIARFAGPDQAASFEARLDGSWRVPSPLLKDGIPRKEKGSEALITIAGESQVMMTAEQLTEGRSRGWGYWENELDGLPRMNKRKSPRPRVVQRCKGITGDCCKTVKTTGRFAWLVAR